MKSTVSYKTKQRDMVLGCMMESKNEHVTAEDLIIRLRQKGTPVGKSTVYRFLNVLVDEGVIRKYLVAEGTPACYQYMDNHEACKNHYHLKCTVCGELLHINCNLLDQIEETLLSLFDFQIDNGKTVLYGKCKNCANHP